MKKILIIILIVMPFALVNNKVFAVNEENKIQDMTKDNSQNKIKDMTNSNNSDREINIEIPYSNNNETAKMEVHDTTDKDYEGKSYDISVTGLKQCGAFGDPNTKGTFAYYLQQIFNVMKFLGIILALILTIKDLVYAVAEQKNDTFPKIGKTALKRVIYAVLIFFLPTVLNFIFSLLGLYGTCGII